MKYIIVHLIRGEAAQAHEAITRDLTATFDTFPIHDRIIPHLTLKRWFELDEAGMGSIYQTLDTFVADHTASDYRLHGYGHFGEDVIYVDVQPSSEMSATSRDLMKVLHTIEGMTFDEFDDIEDDLHATVVMGALKPFDFRQVWDYLNTKQGMDFNMKFDNIAVLKRETDNWVVDRVWELPTI